MPAPSPTRAATQEATPARQADAQAPAVPPRSGLGPPSLAPGPTPPASEVARTSADIIRLSRQAAGASIVVADYFPQAPVGRVRINEFGVINPVDSSDLDYLVQRYRMVEAPDRVSGLPTLYLEDYFVDDAEPGGLRWADTWVLTIDDTGVNEVMDTMRVDVGEWHGIYSFFQLEHPLVHGLTHMRGSTAEHLALITYDFVADDGTTLNFNGRPIENTYIKTFRDLRSPVPLPGGTFDNVVVSDELQDTRYPGRPAQDLAVVYTFYFAPQIGIVAMQYYQTDEENALVYDSAGDLIPLGLLYLVRTCEVSADQYRCPLDSP